MIASDMTVRTRMKMSYELLCSRTVAVDWTVTSLRWRRRMTIVRTWSSERARSARHRPALAEMSRTHARSMDDDASR